MSSAQAKYQPPWKRFTCSVWWINMWQALVCFVPQCLFPAALWSIAGVLVAIGSDRGMKIFTGGSVVTLPDLLQSAAILFGATIVAFALVVWSLALWLAKITAFTRSWMRLPVMSSVLEKSAIVESQKKATVDLKSQKAFLAKYWLCIALFLLPPMLIVCTLTCIKMAATPEVIGTPLLTLSPIVNGIMLLVMSIIMIATTAVSIVAVAIAATTERTPMKAALWTLQLSARDWLPLFLLTTAVIVIDVVVGSPQVLLKLGNPDSMFTVTHNVTELVIENVWQGVTSVLLWTFTIVPVCEQVRSDTYRR